MKPLVYKKSRRVRGTEPARHKLHLAKARAEQIVDAIFDSMVNALKAGDGIEIRGFGSFTVREYKAYDGRNPRTGSRSTTLPRSRT